MLPPPAVTSGDDITVSAIVSGGTEPYTWLWELVNPSTGMTIEDSTSENSCVIKTTSESDDSSDPEIKLTITDSLSNTGSKSVALTINKPAPTLAWDTDLDNSPISLNAGEDVTLSVKAVVA